MGLRGPPPKPPDRKKLEGTFRRDRDADRDAAMVPVEEPELPESLSDDALQIWCEVLPKLLDLKTVSKVDGGVLESYCRALSMARKLDKIAQDDPLLVNDKGNAVLNPAAAEARQLWIVVKTLASDLGLSYASRARNPPPAGEEKKDSAASFLFGRKPLSVVK